MAAVSYHGCDLSAGEHDEEGDAEEDGHQQAEGLEVDPADGDDLRQMAVVDDETAGDGGEEGVVDEAGDEGRAAREDSEGAVVAFFIEFGHCEHSCLTIAVDDEACQRH